MIGTSEAFGFVKVDRLVRKACWKLTHRSGVLQ